MLKYYLSWINFFNASCMQKCIFLYNTQITKADQLLRSYFTTSNGRIALNDFDCYSVKKKLCGCWKTKTESVCWTLLEEILLSFSKRSRCLTVMMSRSNFVCRTVVKRRRMNSNIGVKDNNLSELWWSSIVVKNWHCFQSCSNQSISNDTMTTFQGNEQCNLESTRMNLPESTESFSTK